MSNIINNYRDSGFGNNEIIFTGSGNPFSNIIDQSVYNSGFGSSNKLITIETEDSYINYFSLNFGNRTPAVDQSHKKYVFEEIFERGEKTVNKNSFVDIVIKNKLITDPVFLVMPANSNVAVDTVLEVERIKFNTFRVYNSCDQNIQSLYIATQNNISVKDIPRNINGISVLNSIVNSTLV